MVASSRGNGDRSSGMIPDNSNSPSGHHSPPALLPRPASVAAAPPPTTVEATTMAEPADRATKGKHKQASSTSEAKYKRIRSSRACLECKKRKVKCSGNHPCDHCVEYGEVCAWADNEPPTAASLVINSVVVGSSGDRISGNAMTDVLARLQRLEDYIASTGVTLPPLGKTPSSSDAATSAARARSTSATLGQQLSLMPTGNNGRAAAAATGSSADETPPTSAKRKRSVSTVPSRPLLLKAEEAAAARMNTTASPSSAEIRRTSSMAPIDEARGGEGNGSVLSASPRLMSSRRAGVSLLNRNGGDQDDILEGSPDHKTSQLMPDRKGLLRYLGPASTSTVVAELADRQRWDAKDGSRRSEKPWSIFNNLGVTIAGSLPPIEDVEFPPDDLAETLLNAFFDLLSPTFPVLHKTHFVADWKTLKEKGITKADPVFLCILFAVFACGSLVVKDERVNAEGGYSAKSVPDPKTGDYSFGLAKSHRNRGVERPGARFYAQANVLLLRTVAEPSVELAILYGLMAFYHVANNAAARSWVLCGQALRIAIECGLHRSSASFRPMAREKRRRVFWALYSLEGILTLNLGRPPSLPEDEIDQELPLDVDLDTLTDAEPAKSHALSGFLHNLSLHRLAAGALRVISRNKRGVAPVLNEMEMEEEIGRFDFQIAQWYTAMPPNLARNMTELSPIERTQRLIMLALFPSMRLLLYLPLLPLKGSQASDLQIFALSRCITASRDLIEVAGPFSASVPPGHYCFDFSSHLLVAGALLLLLCYRGLTDQVVLDDTFTTIERCVAGLSDLGKTFVGGKIGLEMLASMRDAMKLQSGLAVPSSHESVPSGPVALVDQPATTVTEEEGVRRKEVSSERTTASSSNSPVSILPSRSIFTQAPSHGAHAAGSVTPTGPFTGMNLASPTGSIASTSNTANSAFSQGIAPVSTSIASTPSYTGLDGMFATTNGTSPYGWPLEMINFQLSGLDELTTTAASNYGEGFPHRSMISSMAPFGVAPMLLQQQLQPQPQPSRMPPTTVDPRSSLIQRPSSVSVPDFGSIGGGASLPELISPQTATSASGVVRPSDYLPPSSLWSSSNGKASRFDFVPFGAKLGPSGLERADDSWHGSK